MSTIIAWEEILRNMGNESQEYIKNLNTTPTRYMHLFVVVDELQFLFDNIRKSLLRDYSNFFPIYTMQQ